VLNCYLPMLSKRNCYNYNGLIVGILNRRVINNFNVILKVYPKKYMRNIFEPL